MSNTPTPLGTAASPTRINLGPISIEATLPKWAIALLSVLILVGLAGTGSFLGIKKIREVQAQAEKDIQNAKNSVLVPKDDMAVYQEQAKHAADHPENKEDIPSALHQDGSILIHHYYSDGCVHIVRYDSAGAVEDQKWIFGPNHKFNPVEAPKPVTSAPLPTSRSKSKNDLALDLGNFADGSLRDAVLRVTSEVPVSRSHLSTVQNSPSACLDPHPGTFTFQNQQLNQCLVQVNRFFTDGCAHFQYYNPCNGMWDVWPNGAAKVTWVRCFH